MSSIRLVTRLVKLILQLDYDQNLLADACQATRELGLLPNTPRWMMERLPIHSIKENCHIIAVNNEVYLVEIILTEGTSTIFVWVWKEGSGWNNI